MAMPGDRDGGVADPVGEVGLPRAAHPLDAIGAGELVAAVEAVRATGRLADSARFASVTPCEPGLEEMSRFEAGGGFERLMRVVVVPGPEASLVEAVVEPSTGTLRSWMELEDVRPAVLFEEAFMAMVVLKEHPEWQAAMRRRGIENLDLVQVDPWPAGCFGEPFEAGRRIARCLSYVRETPSDNGYARPVEGVIGIVDLGRAEVLEVVDQGVVPLPPERGSYDPADLPAVREPLSRLDIVQPEGPGFVVDGNLVSWGPWSFRVSVDPYEGLVLHRIGYEDGGRFRLVIHRASISEMVVPYGDPGPMHGWKSAFDAGEWGLGRMTNSLALGCDCLGEIRYLDAVFATEQGDAYSVANAVCLHEEDYGILWKHVDLFSGTSQVRRSRRMVVSSIATVGNYEYGFFWYLYLDGTIQLEVKLTGILSTMALEPGTSARYASVIAPQLAAPYHQHLFNARIHFALDGVGNSVYEVESTPEPPGDANPLGNAFRAHERLLERESEAQRVVDPSRSRYWKVVAPSSLNRLGRPVGYKLVPGPTPTLLARPESSVGSRAAFASKNLWVTRYAADERRAAGEYPNQHPGGDGLVRYAAADRSIVDDDIVVWYSFGLTHIPRPEDWPVMPVEYTGFVLAPVGFFDSNPALDLAPPEHACHTG